MKERARSHFFMANSVDIDRYNKHEVLDVFDREEDAGFRVILNDRSRFQKHAFLPGNIYEHTYIPQFQNVPYLRRFRIGKKIYITAFV